MAVVVLFVCCGPVVRSIQSAVLSRSSEVSVPSDRTLGNSVWNGRDEKQEVRTADRYLDDGLSRPCIDLCRHATSP